MNRAHLLAQESPVFFNRGPSPATRWVLYSLISAAAIVFDYRFHYLAPVRQVVATALHPIQMVLSSPLQAYDYVAGHFAGRDELLTRNAELQQRLLEQSAELQGTRAMAEEYAHLKTLMGVPERLNGQGVIVEIVRVPRSPFNRRVMLSRGSAAGIRAGLPVVDATGVVGQVTAVTPLSSEVTLITDKDQAVPAMVARNGLRVLVSGNGRDSTLGIPFLPASADIQPGDVLVTSGIDGTYPPGLAVAKVEDIDRSAAPFVKVIVYPVAGVDRHRFLMVLTTNPATSYPNVEFSEPSESGSKSATTPGRRSRAGRRP